MIDPDDNDDGALSPTLRALLDDGGAGPAVPNGVPDRLLGKVMVSVGVTAAVAASSAAAATTTTTATAAKASAATLTKALVFKVALGVVGATVVGGGIVVATQATPTKTTTTTQAVATTTTQATVKPVSVPAVVAAAEAPLPPRNRGEVAEAVVVETPIELSLAKAPKKTVKAEAPATTTTTTTNPEPASTPEPAPSVDEAALLERARLALANADPVTALKAIDEHARLAPQGALVEEREALRVIALARAGRGDEARVAGEEFLRRWPRSLLADRVSAVIR